MIKFAEGYKEAIENETKQITIRKGIVNNLFPGQIEETNIGVQLRIKSVVYSTFIQITQKELEDDGFISITNCIMTMKKFYADCELLDLCTIIRFEKVNGG
ncbi:MAG TPA: hypothetical protein ENI23_07265 [bacterium]|nr:hypothetical protein [bacterium]